MNITIDGSEVEIPSGNYGDEDDMLCRGCGAEVGCWSNHTVVDCLVTLRQQIEELKGEHNNLLKRNPVLGGEVKKEPCNHKVTHDTTSSDGRMWKSYHV
jgi:hypothetical protein